MLPMSLTDAQPPLARHRRNAGICGPRRVGTQPLSEFEGAEVGARGQRHVSPAALAPPYPGTRNLPRTAYNAWRSPEHPSYGGARHTFLCPATKHA